MANLHHHCDFCFLQLEEEDREVPIYILKFPDNNMYFFCCEFCMDEFLKDCTLEGYVYPSGAVEIDD